MITALEKVALVMADAPMRRDLGLISPVYGDAVSASRLAQTLVTGLSQAQIFDATNIVGWLDLLVSDMTPEKYAQFCTDLPTCYPPYTFTYLEWQFGESSRFSTYVVCPQEAPADGETRAASVLIFEEVERLVYHVGTVFLRFDAEGRVTTKEEDGVVVPETTAVYSEFVRAQPQPKVAEEANQIVVHTVGTCLFMFSLLHCTNVHAVEVDPRQGMSRQQRRDIERKKKDPVLYKVLEVKPFGSYRRSATERPGEGRTKRLHHVRGHFMEFGPEYGKGLAFGRIAGRFYCPPHIRGDLGEGVVSKTYKLAKPTGKEDHDGWRDR